jgi:ABC-type glycerol-3-phosphate transport system substrate-binding protein
MLDESVDPPRLVFNSPSVVEAFRWYTSLATQYQVEPVFENTEDFGGGERQRQTLINEGRVAMWMASGGGGFGRFGGPGGPDGQTDLNLGVVPLPTGPNSAQGSGFQSVSGYFVSAQTEARQACWTWITFLTEQANVASGLPARRSVAESTEYRQRVGDEQADAYLASVSEGSRASFYQRISDEGNWLGFVSFWLSDAYDRVISGEMTVEESLDAAQESIDAFRDCVIANDAFQDPETMMQCLSESGANAPGAIAVPRP